MYYIPLALVLGSDRKPAKIRMACEDLYDSGLSHRVVLDFWLTEGDLQEVLSSQTTPAVIHSNSMWKVPCYRFLPIVDIDNKIVRDGLIIRRGAGTERRVYDAHGESKLYFVNHLNERVAGDKNRVLFCNLDYDSVPHLLQLSKMTQYQFPDSELSADLRDVASQMNSFVSYTSGMVRLQSGYFQSNTVFLPDNWREVESEKVLSNTLAGISCPKMMSRLQLQLESVPNLKTLALPEVINGVNAIGVFSLGIELKGNNCLEELILPSAIVNSSGNIKLVNCTALKSIKQRQSQNGYCTRSLFIQTERCPALSYIDVPSYELVSLSVDNFSHLKRLRCQSSTFGVGRIQLGQKVYPEIYGVEG